MISADIRPEVLVHPARPDVAAFMFDPANDLAWTGGITASRPAPPGPLVPGATVERTAPVPRTHLHLRVRRHGAPTDRLVELKVDKPFPMLVRYELRDAPDGATLVAIHATGSPGGFFGWAGPIMARQVRRSLTADLHRLRANLET